jgi:DNA-directed RNA polymerase subunit M/transcription elongation factor TFIIS
MAFNAQKKLVFKDEPKMRIVAPAMIPMEIYRNQDGEEFNVEFTDEQIELIHTEIMQIVAKGESLFNFEHDKSQKVPAYILEAWIVDNPETDKAKTTYGIDVPKGTLMLTTQITDRKYYDELVENGQIGYSIGGSFGLKLSKQLNTNTMEVQLSEGKQYLFKDGKLVEVEAALSETQTEEISVEDSMNCPSCGENEKIKIQSLRRTEGNKVKPLDLLVCKNCGSIYTNPNELFDSL